MINIFEFLLIIFTYLLFGILPLQLLLFPYIKSQKALYIISIGAAPVYLALIQILSITAHFSTGVCWLLNIALILSILIWRKRAKTFSFRTYKKGFLQNYRRIGGGIIFGFIVWRFLNFPSISKSQAYIDQIWNLSITQELLRSFPPQYPMWYDQSFQFIYHYITNIFWASLSLITTISPAKITFYYSALVSWIAVGIIFSLMMRTFRLSYLIFIFFLSLFLYPNLQWPPAKSYLLHLSTSASNFLWGLPILLGSWTIWRILTHNRFVALKNGDHSSRYIPINFIFSFILTFAKGSFGISIIALELVRLFQKRRYFLSLLVKKKNLKQLLSFALASAAYPLGILAAAGTMPGTKGISETTVIFRDKFSGIVSQSYVNLTIFLIGWTFLITFSRRQKGVFSRSLPFFFLVHILLYIFLTHQTFSEVYFVFNIFVMNLIVLIETPFGHFRKLFIPVSMAILIFGLLFPGTMKLGAPMAVLATPIESYDSIDYASDQFKDLEHFEAVIPKMDWVWVPSSSCKSLSAAAALNHRVFSECPYLTTPSALDILSTELDLKSTDPLRCKQIFEKYGIRYFLFQKNAATPCKETEVIDENRQFTLFKMVY